MIAWLDECDISDPCDFVGLGAIADMDGSLRFNADVLHYLQTFVKVPILTFFVVGVVSYPLV